MSFHKFLKKEGYLVKKDHLDDKMIKQIKRDLTVSPIVLKAYQEFVKPAKFEIFQESPNYFYIPRYYGIETFGLPIKTDLPMGLPMNLKFIYDLLPHQITGYEKTLQTLRDFGGGVLQVYCGYGKTACAIKLATELGCKTLVVVNKECLMDQWSESISKFTGQQARIGYIQQDKVDVVNKDFVITMLHSLCKKNYPKEIFNEFSFTVVDECFPANTYIVTNQGNISIHNLHKMWKNCLQLPLIKSFNESTQQFEYNKLLYAWEKTVSYLVRLYFNNLTICCTPNHEFLTINGYKKAINLTSEDLIISHCTHTPTELSSPLHLSYREKILIDDTDRTVYDIEVSNNHNFIVLGQNYDQCVGPVVHNCHHIASEMFSKALPKITTRYMLGLSATPNRKDGLSHVFYKYLGNVCHTERRKGKNQMFVKRLKLTSNSSLYETLYMSNGIKNTVAMITNLTKYDLRTILIVEVIRILMTQDRKILLLSGRRDHLEQIHDLLGQAQIQNIHNKPITFGYYYGNQGNNKHKHKQMLQTSAKCDIVLGTFSISAEGLDLPDLNTEILATPSTDVEQAVGRILRKFHDTVNPLVVDLIDSFGNFTRQASVRSKFYKGENYQINDMKIPLGNDAKDLQPFLSDIKKYLLDTAIRTSVPEINDDDESDEEVSIKYTKSLGKCLLTDEEDKPKTSSVKTSSLGKCLLTDEVDKPHTPPVKTSSLGKCLLTDEKDKPKTSSVKTSSLGKCLLTDEEDKPTTPSVKTSSLGKCLLTDEKDKPTTPSVKTSSLGKCLLRQKSSLHSSEIVTNKIPILPKGKCLLNT